MHRLSTSFVLGYHGCSSEIAGELLSGEPFKPSTNEYDWLGHGIYFWQANPQRALEFAREKRDRDGADWQPAAVGAVIELGLCLDLSTKSGIDEILSAHKSFCELRVDAGVPLPENSGGADRWLRKLDCAVITILHDIRKSRQEPQIDTLVGMFEEGGPLYRGSGFREKTHVQICVRNQSCIKGVFRVSNSDLREP